MSTLNSWMINGEFIRFIRRLLRYRYDLTSSFFAIQLKSGRMVIYFAIDAEQVNHNWENVVWFIELIQDAGTYNELVTLRLYSSSIISISIDESRLKSRWAGWAELSLGNVLHLIELFLFDC